MCDNKGDTQPATPVQKDNGTDYNDYHRNYDDGRSTNKSDTGTTGTGPRDTSE